MKKLILLIGILAFVGFTAVAQESTKRLNKATYVEFNTDVALEDTEVVWFKVTADKDSPQTQDFKCSLDSLSGTPNVAVSLHGSKFGTTYTQIGSTVTWTGTSSDTTIVISNATANRYRFYKLNYSASGTHTSTIDSSQLKLWIE